MIFFSASHSLVLFTAPSGIFFTLMYRYITVVIKMVICKRLWLHVIQYIYIYIATYVFSLFGHIYRDYIINITNTSVLISGKKCAILVLL